MKLFDKFKGLFIETNDDDDLDTPIEPEEQAKTSSGAAATGKAAPFIAKNVVSLQTNPQLKVVIVEPGKFDDAQKIADCLRDDQPVIINFEKTDIDIIKRITDFISGTVYAVGGSIQHVGSDILLCVPKSVDISTAGMVGAFAKRGDTTDFTKEFTPWKDK